MLVQSHVRKSGRAGETRDEGSDDGFEIRLLPALPEAWRAHGRVEGLRLRGGRILKCLEWRDGKIEIVEIE